MKLNNRNNMRMRNMYISAMIKGIEKARNHAWDSICCDFLEEQNELNETTDIAFRLEGDMYPPRAIELNRKVVLYRKSRELDEELIDSFKKMASRFIGEWETSLRHFKNMISTVFREAKNIDEVEQVIPTHIMSLVPDDVEFAPLNTAKGISSDRANELKQQYAMAFNVENFITVSKLI